MLHACIAEGSCRTTRRCLLLRAGQNAAIRWYDRWSCACRPHSAGSQGRSPLGSSVNVARKRAAAASAAAPAKENRRPLRERSHFSRGAAQPAASASLDFGVQVFAPLPRQLPAEQTAVAVADEQVSTV